jgi:mycothiol S-conjugate amidase
VPHDVEAEVWGTDDYELARSLVDAPLPEDDLFAGVREAVRR